MYLYVHIVCTSINVILTLLLSSLLALLFLQCTHYKQVPNKPTRLMLHI